MSDLVVGGIPESVGELRNGSPEAFSIPQTMSSTRRARLRAVSPKCAK